MWKGKYFENVPVSLTANVFNGYKFHHWEVNGVTMLNKTIEINLKKSTTVKAIYEDVVDDGNSVVINEINYNPLVGSDAGDWVEIYNWGRIDLDIGYLGLTSGLTQPSRSVHRSCQPVIRAVSTTLSDSIFRTTRSKISYLYK